MSDASMDSEAPRIVRVPATKVAKPDLYYGDRHKLEGWLLQWDLFFMFEDSVEDIKKATLIASYLRGDAQTWVTPYLIKFMGDNSDDVTDRMFKDLNEFKEHMRQSFATAKEPLIAERTIQRLKQDKSASDYANKFKRYAIQTDWNDAALMRMYRQGLKDNVRIELMRSGSTIDTLDQLISESIRLDNELYEYHLESRGYTRTESPRKKTHYKPNQGHQRSTYRPKTGGHYKSNGPEPMHLDNMQGKPKKHSNPAWDSRKHDSKKAGPRSQNETETRSCYNCGEPGHLSRNCRKNKVIRQLNVLVRRTTEPNDESEEWEVVNSNSTQMGPDSPATESEDELSPDNFTEEQWKDLHRPVTPHPGNRVPTVWDYQIPDNQSEDTPLSMEKLAIHTPPDSPKMVRKETTTEPKWWEQRRTTTPAQKRYEAELRDEEDQCNHDALCVHNGRTFYNEAKHNEHWEQLETWLRENDKGNNWVAEELEAYQERSTRHKEETSVTSYRLPLTNNYLEDPRNPKHGLLQWTGCFKDTCPIHYHEKIGANWQPQKKRSCKWQHFDCPKDTCGEHLFDKRTTGYFPGMDSTEETRTNLLINGHCTNNLWQVCMMEQCKRHEAQKEANGFGINSFLEIRLTPGINPGVATLPTPNTSSNLQ
jgi:hypothetical protein